MKHEKIFLLETGRTLKVIITGHEIPGDSAIRTETEILIKDPKEEDFRPPIGMSHPQFWKLKRMNDEQARLLQIEYSGATDKHINKTLKEFNQINASPELC